MDATVSPWSTLQNLFERWQTTAWRHAPTRFTDQLLAFLRKHSLAAAMLGSALSAVLGAYCMYKFLGSDLPAVRSEYQKISGDVNAFRSDLSAADVQLRSHLDAHITQEKASRDRIATSLRVLTANVVALGSKVESRPLKPHEARELLASVREISLIEAATLESIATVGGVIAEEYTPLLAYARKEEELKEFVAFFGAATPSAQPQYLGKLLLTRQGAWHVLERQILFKWDGGSARLRPRNDLPQSELVRKVELFNSVSRAVSYAAVMEAPRLAPQPKAAPKPVAVTRTNVAPAVTAQRRPQPAKRVEPPKRPEIAPPSRRPPGTALY